MAEMAEEGGRDFVTAFARGLEVLRAFGQGGGDAPRDMTLSDVARIVKLPRATVRRLLHTLAALGYVEARENLFRLSPQVLTLARAYLNSSALPRVAQPFLERVSEALDESCSVSILHGEDVIYVARSARRRISSLHRDVGTHLPAHCSSMGRVLLAALPEPALAAFFARARLPAFTPHTIREEGALRAELERVRREGYALVENELEIDLRGVAVPIHNAAGAVVAAFNVSTSASRTPRARMLGPYLAALRGAAADIRPLLVG